MERSQQAEPSYNTVLVMLYFLTAQMTHHDIRNFNSDHRHNMWSVHGVVSFPYLRYWSKYMIVA